MCIKGLDYRLSHDCHFDIDRDVSTALHTAGLVPPWLLVIGVSRTSLMVGGFDPKHC